MTMKTKARLNPDEVFAEAIAEDGQELSLSELRLLTSGLSALRAAESVVPLNKIEMKAVRGMISYVAQTQNVCEETVGSILAAVFGVRDIKALPARCYNEIIKYLVDVKLSKVMN